MANKEIKNFIQKYIKQGWTVVGELNGMDTPLRRKICDSVYELSTLHGLKANERHEEVEKKKRSQCAAKKTVGLKCFCSNCRVYNF